MLAASSWADAGIHGDGYAEGRDSGGFLPALARSIHIMELLFQYA
jgi:hypothetical protein